MADSPALKRAYFDDQFSDWCAGVEPELKSVRRILSDKLSENPLVLDGQLRAIEAYYSRLSEMLADCNAFLTVSEERCMPERSAGPEDVRKATMRAETVLERRMCEIINGMCKSIANRMTLGMSLLKTHRDFGGPI